MKERYELFVYDNGKARPEKEVYAKVLFNDPKWRYVDGSWVVEYDTEEMWYKVFRTGYIEIEEPNEWFETKTKLPFDLLRSVIKDLQRGNRRKPVKKVTADEVLQILKRIHHSNNNREYDRRHMLNIEWALDWMVEYGYSRDQLLAAKEAVREEYSYINKKWREWIYKGTLNVEQPESTENFMDKYKRR